MIAIDIGQSGSRSWVDGVLTTYSRGRLSNEVTEDALRAIAQLLPAAKSEVVALSLTGLFGQVEDVSDFYQTCSQAFGAKEVLVLDDGLASYFGALGGKDGVALTLGGGIVAVGGRAGRISHTDGLGGIFGDEGSGYWLGNRAITRALAAREGRDDDEHYLRFFAQEVASFDSLEVKNAQEAVTLAIQTGKRLLEAADQDLPIAVAIREEGAARLANTVIAAWKKAGGQLTESPFLTITGGLSGNQSYVQSILNNIYTKIPGAVHVQAMGDNLAGALWAAENLASDLAPLAKWAKS